MAGKGEDKKKERECIIESQEPRSRREGKV
jgi:hypothetical protein